MTRTELIKITNEAKQIKETKLNRCSAHIILGELENGRAVDILKSYNTLVAIFSRRTGTLYVFDKYSNTTYQHIYKAFICLNADRIAWLYKRSDNVLETRRNGSTFKPTRYERQNLEKFDYSMEIENFLK